MDIRGQLVLSVPPSSWIGNMKRACNTGFVLGSPYCQQDLF